MMRKWVNFYATIASILALLLLVVACVERKGGATNEILNLSNNEIRDKLIPPKKPKITSRINET